MKAIDLECKDLLIELDKIGKGAWITIFHLSKENQDIEQKTYFSALISNEKISTSLEDYSWDINLMNCGRPGLVSYFDKGEEIIEYYRYSTPDVEHLVYWRTFPGIDDNYFELSEEFRLFYDLYKKDNSFYIFDDNGDEDLVAEILDKEVRIKLKYLKKYISTRKMSLAIFFEYMRFSKNTLKEANITSIDNIEKLKNITYSKLIENYDFTDSRKSRCWILGKKIIGGIKGFKPSIWDEEKPSQKFIIGIDEEGNEVYFTSNDDFLADNFGKNPDSPHYLTPVYFKKDVLAKYYSNPLKYDVEDGIIRRKGFWSLRIDNNNPDYIVVFLGDLGKLHNREQLYWKGFNYYSENGISRTSWERSFLGEYSDPKEVDLYFKYRFNTFQKKWEKKFGWKLFKTLLDEDLHHFKTLHIPLNEEQKEFDEQVMSLTKTLIDSLNEKKLKNEITIELKDEAKGIDKFQAFLESKGKPFPEMIQFLRDLQALRSTGSAHRKGSKYKKTQKIFNLRDDNFKSVFKEILIKSIMIFNTLDKYFLN
jgi:hypothetical protein